MKKAFLYQLILSGLFLLNVLTIQGQNLNINPHYFEDDDWEFGVRCNPCHLTYEKSDSSSRFIVSYENDSIVNNKSLTVSNISKLCYTCHDGIAANFSHNPLIANIGNEGSYMTFNHPISIVYKANNKGKNRLYDPDITSSGLGNTISKDLLKDGKVECTSCHDAHFSSYKTACKTCPTDLIKKQSKYPSLWKENYKSALCLTCHNI